jgi:hypothetical protein
MMRKWKRCTALKSKTNKKTVEAPSTTKYRAATTRMNISKRMSTLKKKQNSPWMSKASVNWPNRCGLTQLIFSSNFLNRIWTKGRLDGGRAQADPTPITLSTRRMSSNRRGAWI